MQIRALGKQDSIVRCARPARIDTAEVTFNGYADNGQIGEAVVDGEGR